MDIYEERSSTFDNGFSRSLMKRKSCLLVLVVGVCSLLLSWACLHQSGSYVTLEGEENSSGHQPWPFQPFDLNRQLTIPNKTQDEIEEIGGAVAAMKSQLDDLTTSMKDQLNSIIQKEQELRQQLTAIAQER